MRRRQLVAALGTAAVGSLAGCSDTTGDGQTSISVTSPPLESSDDLPVRYTCDGAGESPPFVVEAVPHPTVGLAVVAEYDRGLINEPVFWTLWNVPPDTERIPAGLPRTASLDSLGDARQGRPEGGEVGYEPPCPPTGRPYEHRFQVYALSDPITAPGGTDHDTATEQIGDVVLASTRVTVDYERTPSA
jgi:phosphatidylethanolamine-binding protein (PEBP) family uncharacterized protein